MTAEVGRPTVMTPETIAKLEEAFRYGASDKEACFIADIGVSTLYKYQEENPEYVERKEGLKNMMKYQARVNVSKDLAKGIVDTSMWFLEKKAKDEFSSKTETEHSGTLNIAQLLDKLENGSETT